MCILWEPRKRLVFYKIANATLKLYLKKINIPLT